jgi:peptidoglycan/xylan/chitin deacetylase (PgdA/CDA1 family)
MNNDSKHSFVSCFTAMSTHFYNKSNKYYMGIDNLRELADSGVEIGAHSFTHQHIKYEISNNKLRHVSGSYIIFKSKEWIKEDTEKLLYWFNKYLKITPTSYCFPFNQESDNTKNILIDYGFKNFYGKNRININFY